MQAKIRLSAYCACLLSLVTVYSCTKSISHSTGSSGSGTSSNGSVVDPNDPASADTSLKLVWSDEFTETTIDTSSWNYVINGNGGGNGEAEYYTSNPTNASIQNGSLVITALLQSYMGANYTSARLNTLGKESWTYGRMEARIQLPEGRGIWPAFWAQSAVEPIQWPLDGELDIMESVGYRPDTSFSTIHCEGSGAGNWLPVPTAGSAFHTYSMDWTADSLKFYVDTSLADVYVNPHLADSVQNYNLWPFNHPFFLILNVAVGGAWGGIDGIDNSTFPQSMTVDWVRVYQKK